MTYILQVLQQIRYSFSFIVGKMGFIDAIPGAASTQASRDMTPSVDCRQARQTGGDDSTHAVLNRPASGPRRRLSRGWREEDGGQCDSDLCGETLQLIEMRRLDGRGWRQLHEPQVKLRDGKTKQWRVISNRAPRKQSDSDSPAKLGIDKKKVQIREQ